MKPNFGQTLTELFFSREVQKFQCPVCGKNSPPYGFGLIEWKDRHKKKHAAEKIKKKKGTT